MDIFKMIDRKFIMAPLILHITVFTLPLIKFFIAFGDIIDGLRY